MPPVGFEPSVLEGERPQTYALDRAATGTGYVEVRGECNILEYEVLCDWYTACGNNGVIEQREMQ